MSIAYVYLILGMVFAAASGGYLIWESFKRKSHLDKYGKLLYFILGAVNIYAGFIYLFVLIGCLSIPGYGDFVRPVLVPILAGDGFVAFYHRNGKND